jgi:FlaA1/EpsC-like NDP-sugar epimerase
MRPVKGSSGAKMPKYLPQQSRKLGPSPLMILLYDLTHPSSLSRFIFFLLFDILIIIASLYLSLLVHFDFNFNIVYTDLTQEIILFFIVSKIAFLAGFRVYKITWRYIGVSDLVNIVMAVVISEMVLLICSLPYSFVHLSLTGLSKRIFLVDGIITLIFISALRISKKLYLEVIREKGPVRKGTRTLIVGAGNTGEMILRDMMQNSYANFYPIGFLDDDRNKIGTYIHGIKILGALATLEQIISRENVESVVIAIPSLNHQTLRSLYHSAQRMRVRNIKVVPRIYDFDKPDINLKGLEDISIEDLIGRQIISVDYRGIRNFLHGKSVLITGAGGSIGSEIVVQACTFEPLQVILFDIDETELHNLGLKLIRLFPELPDRIVYVTGDIRDEQRINEVFGQYRPQIVFHSAAYKHVPMMEYNPQEAVKANVFGTYNVALAASRNRVEKFVMISTDKAVRPTSVMGATKRLAEYVCMALNRNGLNHDGEATHEAYANVSPATQFISVRFGNVLGSRGSVLPLFLDQLKHGGPLTVTHKEMRRYFMTIPEAVSLVLQASIMGKGGEVFVLDMGEPVKILDIAEELIKIHGLEPYRDIDIKFTGLRPGEKLFEEILTAEEGTEASRHEKVFVAKNSEKYTLPDIEGIMEQFKIVLRTGADEAPIQVRSLLKQYVKHFEIDEEKAGG